MPTFAPQRYGQCRSNRFELGEMQRMFECSRTMQAERGTSQNNSLANLHVITSRFNSLQGYGANLGQTQGRMEKQLSCSAGNAIAQRHASIETMFSSKPEQKIGQDVLSSENCSRSQSDLDSACGLQSGSSSRTAVSCRKDGERDSAMEIDSDEVFQWHDSGKISLEKMASSERWGMAQLSDKKPLVEQISLSSYPSLQSLLHRSINADPRI